MLLSRIKLAQRTIDLASKRTFASLKGPIVDTPSVVYNGKVYKKLVYPYTFTAWYFNSPWIYWAKESWYLRYMFYSAFLVFPLIYHIHNLVNSPENKAYWKEKRKRDYEKEHKKEWEI